jgi:hypothetical protein
MSSEFKDIILYCWSLIFWPSYKHRVICFLLSHANAFSSDFGKIALLRSIATVPDKAKIQILLPSMKTLVEESASKSDADLFSTISEELTMRLLASYDVEAAGTLNNDAESWEVFSKVVRTFLRPGSYFWQIETNCHTECISRHPAACSENRRSRFVERVVFVLESTSPIGALFSTVGNWDQRSVYSEFRRFYSSVRLLIDVAAIIGKRFIV